MTPAANTINSTPAALRDSRSASRRARDRKRLAGRVLLVIGVVMVALAAGDFVHQGYIKADCSETTFSDWWTGASTSSLKSDGCALEVTSAESEQRLDACIVISAVAILIVSGRTLRKYRHRFASH